jgi:NAD(P)-dependent dehydrogenase (short-subunit alcohol dehydrogenase family)
MASFASVRQAATRFMTDRARLDVLVNNAGIVVRERRLTADGQELTWATNVLGPFLLTRLLLPALRNAPGPRVVNVASGAHKAGRMHWDDLGLERRFRGIRAYAQSKLALVLFTRELARREPGVSVNAVHPGAIWTGIWRAAPGWAQWILGVVLPPAEKGARPVVRLAAAPELDGVTGRYFTRERAVAPSRAATSDADAARLWQIAEEATSPG